MYITLFTYSSIFFYYSLISYYFIYAFLHISIIILCLYIDFFVCLDFFHLFVSVFHYLFILFLFSLNANYVGSSELNLKHNWLVWYDL